MQNAPIHPERVFVDPLDDEPPAGDDLTDQDERPELEDEPTQIDGEQYIAALGGDVQILR